MNNSQVCIPDPQNEEVLSYAPGSKEKAALKSELKKQLDEVVAIPLVIAGQHIETKTTTPVVCPHSHKHILAKTSQASETHIHQAIESSLKAQKDWQDLPWTERVSVFLRAAELLAGPYRQVINASTMLGQSKTCFQAEIDAACELIDFFKFNAKYAQSIYAVQPPRNARGQWNRTQARSLEGFVFAVAPFNFTSIALNLACSPALMGCTVLWKPAPTAALSSYLGLKVLETAGLPPGVINMVHGDPQMIGNLALKHRELSGIHFTGSTRTFEYLWSEVGKNIATYKQYPRLVGETGGKGFVFAHASAQPEDVVAALIRGAFEYQGQKCSAASRAYIPKSLWQKIQTPLIEQTNAIKMGNPENFTNFMGAVIDERSFTKIKGYIDQARTSNNAKILCGGECDNKDGFFIRPTIIQAMSPDYTTMVEEIFGPVLSVYVYKDSDLDACLEYCSSSTPYSLTGAIFAQDRQVIQHMSDKLAYAAGNFYINDKPTGAVVGQQPFGGSRKSGTNDKAGSLLNLLRWVSVRTVKENFTSVTDYRYPFMAES